MKLMRGRLAAVSVRASLGAGAWVGACIGLVVGAMLGAVVAWLAGVGLGWQRDLAYTLGVNRTLLPLGDQIPAMRWLSSNWFLVVPAAAVIVAVVLATVGGLIGALLAAAYNRSPRHASVVVELRDEPGEPEEAPVEPVAAEADAAPAPAPQPAGRGRSRRGVPKTRRSPG